MASRSAKSIKTDPKADARGAKGEATREKIREAVKRMLTKTGYHDLRITNIAKQAKISAGLFYRYYPNIETLVLEILEEKIKSIEKEGRQLAAIETSVENLYELIHANTALFVKSYSEETGVMRCIHQFCSDNAAFRRSYRQSARRQAQKLVDSFPVFFPGCDLTPPEIELVVVALSSQQNLLIEYYIERDKTLTSLKFSQAEMSEWLSVIFYRGLFCANPPEEKLAHARKLLTVVKR